VNRDLLSELLLLSEQTRKACEAAKQAGNWDAYLELIRLGWVAAELITSMARQSVEVA
jgi:hypothetical protein